jgi:hypothetical protein
MSIFNPGLVLFDIPPRQTTTTQEERAEYKSRRHSQRLRELVERLDEIVRRSK